MCDSVHVSLIEYLQVQVDAIVKVKRPRIVCLQRRQRQRFHIWRRCKCKTWKCKPKK